MNNIVRISNIAQDTLPLHFNTEMERAIPETLRMNIGRYDFFPVDSTRLFFDFNEHTGQSVPFFPVEHIGLAMPFSIGMHSVFFLIFLFSFVLFAVIFRWEGAALVGNFRSAFIPGKQSSSVHKNQITKIEVWGEFYLILQSAMIFSVLLFTWLRSREGNTFTISEDLLFLAGLFAGITLLIYLKIFGYRLIGTFFLQDGIKGWVNFYCRVIEFLGIVFFLPVIFYVFIPEIRTIVFHALIILFFISRLVIYIELLNIFVKNKIAPFYFFVYLCGTEIAPYLLLYKGALLSITIARYYVI